VKKLQREHLGAQGKKCNAKFRGSFTKWLNGEASIQIISEN